MNKEVIEMKVNIFPIVSSLHDKQRIQEASTGLLEGIKKHLDFEYEFSSISNSKPADLNLILVLSGGSEGLFLEQMSHFSEPYYLLTTGANNSLAASMEILSYLKAHNYQAEILHGQASYIASRIKILSSRKKEEPDILGVLGKPSDWLIASDVNYDVALKRFNVKLEDISLKEVEECYAKSKVEDFKEHIVEDECLDMQSAKKVDLALNQIIEKHNLKGLTIRCFDLLSSIKATSCLSLALLNKRGIIGTCEGDIPSMLSMYLVKKITGESSFQANPSEINPDKNEIIFAHCTLPLDMTSSYNLDTHFESGMGVAIKAKLKLYRVTIFKLSSNLKDYFIEEGTIIENLDRDNLCRTQIKIKLDDNISYFLKNPYGNHHVILYGDHKKRIKNYLDSL